MPNDLKQMKNDRVQKEAAEDSKQIEKDRRQKEAAADAAKSRCPQCMRYTDKVTQPQCFGHSGGGGGGGSSSTGSSSNKTDQPNPPTNSGSSTDQVVTRGITSIAIVDSILLTQQLVARNDIKFNAEIISELLTSKILSIENNMDSGILTIKLNCEPKLLSTEVRNELAKYIEAILNVFKTMGIPENCATVKRDESGNFSSLCITIPQPNLYDAFIQRLADLELLPKQNIQQKTNEDVTYQSGINHFNSMPFSNKLAPAKQQKKLDDEEKYARHAKMIRPKVPGNKS